MKQPLIVLCTLFIVHCSFAQQYGWKNISSTLPDLPHDTVVFGGDTLVSMIRASHFLNDSEGWIVIHNAVDSSFILHTENGGNSWELRSTHNTAFNSIFMRDQNTGFVGGQNGGIIYKTNDGGYTWNFHWTMGVTLAEIEFPPLPADTGYACGMNGNLMMITPTGGEIVDVNVNSDLHGLSFPVNSNQGWLSGWSIVRHYLNGTWYADQVHITGYHTCIHFIDNQTGWTCGDRIMHTTDGYNWTIQLMEELVGDLFSISFADSETGCAVGSVGQVFFTVNGGEVWTKMDLGTTEFLIDVHMTSPTCGYITGQGKQIFKYTQVIGVDEQEGAEALQEVTVKVFPNPAGDNCKLQIVSCKGEECGFIIWDVYGRNVMEFTSGVFPAEGIEIDVSTLRPGIYFVQVRTGSSNGITRLIKQ